MKNDHEEQAADLVRRLDAVTAVNDQLLALLLEVRDRVNEIVLLCRSTNEDIDEIRRLRRSESEKLLLIEDKIDQLSRKVVKDAATDIAIHTRILERSIHSWQKLEVLSQEFLVVGEYLYSKLQSEDDFDFSPVILQYCRSLEHEIGRKSFVAFIEEFVRTPGEDVDGVLRREKEHEKDGVRSLVRNVRNIMEGRVDKFDLTLGQMREILRLAFGKTATTSLLLQGLAEFVMSNRHAAARLTKQGVEELDLDRIVNELRNKCAHPHKLGVEQAELCKELVTPALNRYLD